MKKILAVILGTMLSAALSLPAFAGVWRQNSIGWWYDNQDGTWPAGEWKWIDGNSDGIAECYCFDGNGYLLVSTTTPEGFTVNADGQWTRDGKVQTKTEEELYYTYDPSSRIYAWMNGIYAADDGRTVTLDAAGGSQVAVQLYCYSEDGWNTSYLSGRVDENTHSLIVNDYFDQNGQPTVYRQLNVDGEAREIWLQTYDMNGSYTGSWNDGWYYRKQ